MLTRAEAKKFYDAWGLKQDRQSYEDPALDDLLRNADFAQMERVFELGCGTGRFAKRLLSESLPASARYRGVDLSQTMVQIAQERLAEFGDRARVILSDGSLHFDLSDHSLDCFLSTYVLDLLPVEDIRTALIEARRVLKPEGKLCLVSLTDGKSAFSRLVSWGWKLVHAVRPIAVGGCRPLQVENMLAEGQWQVVYQSVVTSSGISSEIMIAQPR